jgi:hypothetical protein
VVVVLEQSPDADHICNTAPDWRKSSMSACDIQSDPAVLEEAILRGTGGEAHLRWPMPWPSMRGGQ